MARSTFVVKTTGFRELERRLAEELPKATSKKVLRKVAKGALEPMADAAAAKAPVRSGRLAFSIAVSEKPTRRATWKKGKFTSERSSGIAMAMGPAAGAGTLIYASFDEFGTVDTPAEPFIRPTWDAGAERALDYVKDNLGREIDQAVGRIAARNAKAK